MRFFRYLPFVALAVANPAPSLNEDAVMNAALNMLMARAAASPIGPLAQASASLDARQLNLGDLTGLLSNLSASFSAIEGLLQPATLNNIEAVVNDLASLFASPTGDQTKSLIGTVSNLIGSDSVQSLLTSLPTLLGSVSGLLTPALISNVTDILGNAHDLLTPAFVSQTTGLIADVAPLVSAISQVISALLAAVFGTG